MSYKNNVTNVAAVERRRHWRDRRAGNDRRNPARLALSTCDCRSVAPRRAADIGGELTDGNVWWNGAAAKKATTKSE